MTRRVIVTLASLALTAASPRAQSPITFVTQWPSPSDFRTSVELVTGGREELAWELRLIAPEGAALSPPSAEACRAVAESIEFILAPGFLETSGFREAWAPQLIRVPAAIRQVEVADQPRLVVYRIVPQLATLPTTRLAINVAFDPGRLGIDPPGIRYATRGFLTLGPAASIEDLLQREQVDGILATRAGRWPDVVLHAERMLEADPRSLEAPTLQIPALRELGRLHDAQAAIDATERQIASRERSGHIERAETARSVESVSRQVAVERCMVEGELEHGAPPSSCCCDAWCLIEEVVILNGAPPDIDSEHPAE